MDKQEKTKFKSFNFTRGKLGDILTSRNEKLKLESETKSEETHEDCNWGFGMAGKREMTRKTEWLNKIQDVSTWFGKAVKIINKFL
jgi:hypothetical protein